MLCATAGQVKRELSSTPEVCLMTVCYVRILKIPNGQYSWRNFTSAFYCACFIACASIHPFVWPSPFSLMHLKVIADVSTLPLKYCSVHINICLVFLCKIYIEWNVQFVARLLSPDKCIHVPVKLKPLSRYRTWSPQKGPSCPFAGSFSLPPPHHPFNVSPHSRVALSVLELRTGRIIY